MELNQKQAKPTRYHKGFYRSRTEARWAVFFDAISLPYRYEIEDTYLSALNKRYLPDFYVSSFLGEVAFEIKGKKPTELEQEKCRQFGLQANQIFLLQGSPWHGDYDITAFASYYELFQCYFCGKLLPWNKLYCPDCNNQTYINPFLPSKDIEEFSATFNELEWDYYNTLITLGPYSLNFAQPRPGESALHFAFRMASHARFEFIQNDVPWLYQNECLVFNPAFQTQDWDEAELLCNTIALIEFNIDCAKYLISNNITTKDYFELFDNMFQGINHRGSIDLKERYYRHSRYLLVLAELAEDKGDKEIALNFGEWAHGIRKVGEALPIFFETYNQARYYVNFLAISSMLAMAHDWYFPDGIPIDRLQGII